MASIAIRVGLLSGEQTTISLPCSATIGELRKAASREMQRSLGKMIAASGDALLDSRTLSEVGLKDGDAITAVVQNVAVAASASAFAAIRADGTVVAWGDARAGGDCSAVQEQLHNVQCIRAASFSFAAIRGDGSVVTWGDHRGGDSSHVQSELHDVCEIQATFFAFAAIRADRSVVTWGQAASGGDCSAVRHQLYDVQEIQSNAFAFAALRADGSVVTWGEDWMGGDSSSVRSELQDVLRIYSRRHSGMFAAIKTRGRIVFWGNAAHFGEINTGLSNIAHFIYAGGRWAAASEDGSLALSFRSIDGERCMQVPDCALKLVQCLDCIAILQKNGEVLFWGRAVPEWLRSELKNVAQLRVTRNASECAAIRSDGSVATWRFRSTGVHAGARRTVRSQLRSIKNIQRNDCGFAALREDGSVVTWGTSRFGGSSAAVRTQLKDVVCIQANNLAFAAVRRDGSVVSWGWSHAGGDSRHVQEELGRANTAPKKKPTPKPTPRKSTVGPALPAGPKPKAAFRVLKKPSKR